MEAAQAAKTSGVLSERLGHEISARQLAERELNGIRAVQAELEARVEAQLTSEHALVASAVEEPCWTTARVSPSGAHRRTRQHPLPSRKISACASPKRVTM